MFNKIHGIFQTALTDLRYQSWQVLAWRVLVKLLSPIFRIDGQILYAFDLKGPVPELHAKLPCAIELAGEGDVDDILSMQFIVLTPEELASLGDDEQYQYARASRTRALARQTYVRQMRMGERCYVARVDGEVGHSNWMRPYGCGTEENCQVLLRPGEIYMTDGHTRLSMRGQGLHLAVHTHMLRVAQQEGCHLAYTITDMTKAVSRRGLKKVGWHRRGAVIYVFLRGFRTRVLFRLGRDVDPMFLRSAET